MCTVTQMINELKGTRPAKKRKHITDMNIDSEVEHKDVKKNVLLKYTYLLMSWKNCFVETPIKIHGELYKSL